MDIMEQLKKELEIVQAGILKLEKELQSSQSVSSPNGGSFSASYLDLGKLHARENELVAKIAALYRAQSGGGGIGLSYPIYCGGL